MTDTAAQSAGAAASAAGAAELPSLADTLSSVQLSAPTHDDTASNLSRRGAAGAASFNLPSGLKRMLANMYDPVTNPDGIINAGIADNSLCRTELLDYFLAKDRLQLLPADLTYADRFTTSSRLLKAIAALFNQRQPDWPEATTSPLPLKKVEVDHIAIASGATGILDQLFWNLCDTGDGVLLSAPYYNAFDHDLTNRAKAKIIEVTLPLPQVGEQSAQSLDRTAFAKETAKAYEDAYYKAKEQGINVRALLLCNPHNPTGTIYPRETIVELAKLAGKHKMHFVSDEIYARSCFTSEDVPEPALFHSMLSIDTLAECALDPSYVHVITSASKDFAVNGFRLGVLVSQHNPELQRAMSCVGILSQSASPAAALWLTWLSDESFLSWYLAENRRRLSLAYQHTLAFFKHHHIPYYPSNAGFFLMVDFTKFVGIQQGMSIEDGRKKELEFVERLLDAGVFVAPGAQYHHPKAGWFRFTFTMEPQVLKLALTRLEKAMRINDQGAFEKGRDLLDLTSPSKLPDAKGDKKKSWFQKFVTG